MTSGQGHSAAEADLEDADSCVSADHTPCSWTTNPSLKGDLDGTSSYLLQGISTLSKKVCCNPSVMSAMVHVQRGQYLCQVFGNPVLEKGIMGKGYN